MDFTIHTVETAPSDSKSALITAKEVFGFISNLEGVCAEAPAKIEGWYGSMGSLQHNKL